ncbi:GyrI-like domain-containing protein [Dactylosporangium sp. NPDC049742]|uniref:GyrI-like domain-containing protein n=1 Tax=Dactylosporangium sp. NPDC049742 TaxID=3154737 RepID=UPI00343C117B
MAYNVVLTTMPARATAVVKAQTTWQEFPGLWKPMLDQVWACLNAHGITRGCRNVMLYLDATPRVEVGVELTMPCPLSGDVVLSTLPVGPVATTVHRGSYAGLAAAHEAVVTWCSLRRLRLAGPRWEVYGPHHPDPGQVVTEVFHLLEHGEAD